MKKILAGIGIMFGLVASVWGARAYLDNYTPIVTHKALDQKVEVMGRSWRIESIQQRVWQLEGYYKCYGEQECGRKMPPEIFNEYRALMAELRKLTGVY